MMVNALWACVIALFGFLFYVHFQYWRDSRQSRRDSSRFEMFAVRDRLVDLVASQQMREDDPAWQMLYITVNQLLDLSYQTTTLGQLIESARHASRIATDRRCAERVETSRSILSKAEQENPEFTQVVQEMEDALAAMARARTPLWQWWTMLLIVLIVVPSLVLVRAARQLFFNPSAALAATLFPRAHGSGPSPWLAAA